MKAADLRNKSVGELERELVKQLEDQFKYKIHKATGQLGQTHLLKQVRRDIARIKTVLNQKPGN